MAYGKIAKLPRTIREQLNRRLAEGEQGNDLVDWLNGLPEVQVVLAEHFFGRAISTQNMSEWKKHGYEAWLLKQELVACAADLMEDAREVEAVREHYPLTEGLTVMLTARYAKLLSNWDGVVNDAFLQQVQGLGRLCRQVVSLRRSEHSGERVQMQGKQMAEKKKSVLEKVYDQWMIELRQWPDVLAAFEQWFQYYKERANGGTGVRP